MKHSYQKGISAVELLIVVVVLGIIFAVVIPQFSKTRELQVLKSTVGDILSSLNKAHSQTLASVNSSSYGVHFQSDQVIIFKGIAFSVGASDNEIMGITAGAIISNITFGGVSGISGDVYFNRLSGIPNTTGTITLSTTNYVKIITISATGAMSVN
ncbi:hypothetical protein EXS45_00170 [Candidatus Nomurabacteria bacterium]|nr:hypothetical protein [Candidatus Nomurabacteria bacterium]